MQQYPQLKARVRYSGVDLIISCLLFRLCYKWMLVDIKNAPDLVKVQVRVFLTLSLRMAALFNPTARSTSVFGTPPGLSSKSTKLRSRRRFCLKYPGSVRVPSQTIKNRAWGDRKAGRRFKLSRMLIPILKSSQKCVRIDERNRAISALQVTALKILLFSWLEIAQRI